jgi:hypothetical protein
MRSPACGQQGPLHIVARNRQDHQPTLSRRKGVIGLMKCNHRNNVRTDRQRRRGERCGAVRGAVRCVGRCGAVRGGGWGGLLEYVRARRYATTGRIGLGLHGTTWAALRSIGSSRDSTEHLMGASRGPDLVGPGRLSCYATPLGLRRRPTLGGFSYRPMIGTDPQVRSSATRPAGLRDPSGSVPEQRLGALEDSEADDCWRTKRSNGHVMLSCQGLCERGLSRVWGFGRREKDAAIQSTQQRYSFEYCSLQALQGSTKRTAVYDR